MPINLYIFAFVSFFGSYGVLLEDLNERAYVTKRIRGCIVDFAPFLETRP
jgi:hypothetical protein